MNDDNKNPNPLSVSSDDNETILQPVAAANGQSYQPNLPVVNTRFEQPEYNKPSKWRYFFFILGILQALGVGVFIAVIIWAIRQAKAGVSGTEFMGLILFVTVAPTVGILALINLIGLPIYVVKHKPRGKWLVFSILSLLISCLLALYGAYGLYQLRVTIPKQVQKVNEQINNKIKNEEQQFATDNANPEITKDEAITLIKSCQLNGLYYTNQTGDKADGNWGELSSTGVVLTRINGKPYRISIADRLISEIIPITREAQKTCSGPQLWHDGRYEQRQSDGTWR